MVRPKPLDRWLWCVGVAAAILMWIFPPKTPFRVSVGLAAVFLCLLHPVWNFWYVEDYLPRRLLSVLSLAVALTIVGFLAPIETNAPTSHQRAPVAGREPQPQSPLTAATTSSSGSHKLEEHRPADMFSVSVEWARVSNGGKASGTNFWAYYPSEKGCEIDSIQAAYFIRIKNLLPTPVYVVGYGVSANGSPLKRILPQIGGIAAIPYEDGRMFGTTRNVIDTLRPGITIDFGQGPGFSWANIPVQRSDFKRGVLLQLDLIDDLLKSPLQPNVPVRGWAFFREPTQTPFPIGGPPRITLETDDSRTFSYDSSLRYPNSQLDNLDRKITVKSFVDLSNCVRE